MAILCSRYVLKNRLRILHFRIKEIAQSTTGRNRCISEFYFANYLKQGIDLFENILKQLEALHDNKEFDVKVRHNHAKALYIDNQYEEALCHANKAIDLSCRINSMTLIGQLYFRKGECLAKLGCDRAEIEDAYEKHASFDILGNHELKESLIKNEEIKRHKEQICIIA